MWIRYRVRLAAAVLLAAAAACDDDDDDGGTEPPTEFEAELSGSEEVPPVETDATGFATVTIEDDQIVYRVEVTDLENALVSHIHVESPGENGPVRLNLCGTPDGVPPCVSGTGVLVEGANGNTVDITFDSLVSAIRAGNAYVNVHTTAVPSGEIRGQLTVP